MSNLPVEKGIFRKLGRIRNYVQVNFEKIGK